jgi:hypothetical protein
LLQLHIKRRLLRACEPLLAGISALQQLTPQPQPSTVTVWSGGVLLFLLLLRSRDQLFDAVNMHSSTPSEPLQVAAAHQRWLLLACELSPFWIQNLRQLTHQHQLSAVLFRFCTRHH